MNEELVGNEGQIVRPGDLIVPVAEQGGRTTNSPPANWGVLLSDWGYALSSGVDKLVLAVDLQWRGNEFFKVLDQLKENAIAQECPMPGLIHSEEHGVTWAYQVSQFGKEGYQWLLTSPEYAIKLGNWPQPRSRPSAMIEISSVALWTRGVTEAVDQILFLMKHVGGWATAVKVSRVDLCLDLMVQRSIWSPDLAKNIVCRARAKTNHESGRAFSGFAFGRGKISCRMYDKPLEIAEKSKKTWFYDIWNIIQDEMPEGLCVIRTEFQLRREILKELGLDTVWDFMNHPRNLWAYCAQEWLKFTDDPLRDPREQTVLPFWKTIQDGFMGGQCGHPLIRAKAVNIKKKQLAQQLIGQLTSLIVIESQEFSPKVELEHQMPLLERCAKLMDLDDESLSERVRRKQGKYLRAVEKFADAEVQRKALGLPVMKKDREHAA